MLKIIIELHPFGSKKRKKVIAEAKIVNNGTGDKEIGNYDFQLSNIQQLIYDGGNKSIDYPTDIIKGVFEGHNRNESV